MAALANLSLRMKTLLSLILVAAFGAAAIADINEPPAALQTAGRKFGRGWSNVLFGFSELPAAISDENNLEGNNALAYGVVRGLHRSFYRFGKGFYEVFTAPFPTCKESFRPPYRPDVIWVHNGYTEFPPELGFESHYSYTRNYNGAEK